MSGGSGTSQRILDVTDKQNDPQEQAFALNHASVLARQYFAAPHLWAARYYAGQARLREDALLRAGHQTIDTLHRAHVVSAVFAAVSFLEAYINELYQDASHTESGGVGDISSRLSGLTKEDQQSLAKTWDDKIWPQSKGDDSYRLQSKYQGALKKKNRYNEASEQMFLDITSLIQLRNALVHFTPESIDVADRDFVMEKRLRGKFADSPFPADPWYLNGCLGAGLAQWSHELVTKFVKDWIGRMGLERDLDAELAGVLPPAELSKLVRYYGEIEGKAHRILARLRLRWRSAILRDA